MDKLEILEHRISHLERQAAILRELIEAGEKELARVTRIKQQTLRELVELKRTRKVRAT